MGIVQEKFQTQFPPRKRKLGDWVSSESARNRNGQPSGNQSVSDGSFGGYKFNQMPPGDEIVEQTGGTGSRERGSFRKTMMDANDAAPMLNADSKRDGFKRLNMSPTADAYTSEHVDVFYGDKTVDGETGFAERGNLLDRI